MFYKLYDFDFEFEFILLLRNDGFYNVLIKGNFLA